MRNIKIVSEGLTELELQEALQKSIKNHARGDAHINESFEDPAMLDLYEQIVKNYEGIYLEMIREIVEALEEEYSDGYK